MFFVFIQILTELRDYLDEKAIKYCKYCGKELVIFTEQEPEEPFDPVDGSANRIEFKACPKLENAIIVLGSHTKIKLRNVNIPRENLDIK